MALTEYTCTKCDEKFKAPNFKCTLGGRHQLPAKTYYAPIANLNVYVSEEKLEMMDTGKNRLVPARMISFVGGTYHTTDSEDQYSLDTENNGLVSFEKWQEIFIDKERRLKMKEQEVDRKLREANELLERAKAQVAGAEKKDEPELVTAAKARTR